MTTSFGAVTLRRWPPQKRQTLRAWDAADELLLAHVAEHSRLDAGDDVRLLIINDSFGALSCSLHQHRPVNWSDSRLGHLAANENARMNRLSGECNNVSALQSPGGKFDLILIKVPKTIALFEEQLIRLQNHIDGDTRIIAAGMLKYLPSSVFECAERIIGTVTTSLAVKKARLLFIQPDPARPPTTSRYPVSWLDPAVGFELSNHANLFSRQRLDSGARFMLEQMSAIGPANAVADLGCGNGVLGIMYCLQQSPAQIRFIDESYMAVACARDNFSRQLNAQLDTAEFEVADGLSNTGDESLDLVLCNPPFHQQQALGSAVAEQFFRDSKRCLKQSGELWLVANRHLAYHSRLRQLFGNCRTVASNRKFVVYKAVKRHAVVA